MAGLFLLLARHGETADNARRIFQGQSGRGLNALGRAQAARLADRLGRSGLDAIVASDLERAVETARIVGDACALDVEIDPGLREVDVGRWSGKGYDEIATLYPEEWAAWQRGLDVRRGGGETYAELAARVDRAIAAIAARFSAGQRVLVVSHGGAIKAWITSVLGLSIDGARALGGMTNAGLTVVERDANARRPSETHRSRIHTFNDAGHLEGMPAEERSE